MFLFFFCRLTVLGIIASWYVYVSIPLLWISSSSLSFSASLPCFEMALFGAEKKGGKEATTIEEEEEEEKGKKKICSSSDSSYSSSTGMAMSSLKQVGAVFSDRKERKKNLP